MISSFALGFLCDLGEVAAVQIFELECVTQVLSTFLFFAFFKSYLGMRLKMPSYVK